MGYHARLEALLFNNEYLFSALLILVPDYEATILERFADLNRKGMINRGSRAVFWSVE